jgi:hypothetical protein
MHVQELANASIVSKIPTALRSEPSKLVASCSCSGNGSADRSDGHPWVQAARPSEMDPIKGDFDCGAFVPVGRNPDLRRS